MKKYDVISFGSAVLDVFVKSPDIEVEKTKRSFTGRALMIPSGIKSEVEELVIGSGGGGTNTAVGFSRLGLKAAVVARCGWDLPGRMVRQELKKEKVSDEFLVQVEGEQTDYSTILISPSGERTILVYRGGTKLEESVIDFRKINSFWFYASSLEGNLKLLAKIIDFAKKNYIKIAVNPGRRELEQRKELLPLLAKVNVLIVNQEEAAKLTGEEFFDPKLFKKAALVSEGMVVVTRGAEGLYLFDEKDRLLKSDGFKMKMVDATGAGDGFGAGFIGGLARGLELEKAVKLGVSNGASAVTQMGAKAGLLHWEHTHNWLAKPLKMEWEKKGVKG